MKWKSLFLVGLASKGYGVVQCANLIYCIHWIVFQFLPKSVFEFIFFVMTFHSTSFHNFNFRLNLIPRSPLRNGMIYLENFVLRMIVFKIWDFNFSQKEIHELRKSLRLRWSPFGSVGFFGLGLGRKDVVPVLWLIKTIDDKAKKKFFEFLRIW